jgi:hypothetical protein
MKMRTKVQCGKRSPTGDQKFVVYIPCFLLNPLWSLRGTPVHILT